MREYDGEDCSEVVLPDLGDGEQEIVLVTHDECYFNSNDDVSVTWTERGESIIKKKGQGRGLMVSDFYCACHGSLQFEGQSAREVIEPGKNRDGFWVSDDMVQQLGKAMEIFEQSHPGCVGLFCFDQSSNHQALPSDALTVAKLTLNDKKMKEYIKPEYFELEGQHYSQDICYPDGHARHGWQKGMRTILQERGLWTDGLLRLCSRKSAEIDLSQPTQCCATHLLSRRPDFLSQPSRLEIAVTSRGHLFSMYPKFHCECNFIERVWGYAKRQTRAECDYSFAALRERVPRNLSEVPVNRVRHFARLAWRYIHAYTKDLDGRAATFAVKQYKSHRRLPDSFELV